MRPLETVRATGALDGIVGDGDEVVAVDGEGCGGGTGDDACILEIGNGLVVTVHVKGGVVVELDVGEGVVDAEDDGAGVDGGGRQDRWRIC